MKQPLDPRAEIDERPVFAHRGDPAGEDGSRDDLLAELLGALLLFLFQERPARHDEVLAAVFPLEDPERVDAALVDRRFGRAGEVDLGDRAEAPCARDPDLEPALDRLFDAPLDGQARPERLLELPGRRGPARELPRQLQAAGGGQHDRLDPVADLDLDVPFGVLQVVDVDRRFALPADVHERDVGPDGDDPAGDRLPGLEGLRLERVLEQPGELVVPLGHGQALADAARPGSRDASSVPSS